MLRACFNSAQPSFRPMFSVFPKKRPSKKKKEGCCQKRLRLDGWPPDATWAGTQPLLGEGQFVQAAWAPYSDYSGPPGTPEQGYCELRLPCWVKLELDTLTIAIGVKCPWMTSVYLHFINCLLTIYAYVSWHAWISLILKHWQYHKESIHTAFLSMLKMKSMTSMGMILKNKPVQATVLQRNRTFVIFGCHNQSYDILADLEMGGQYNETRPTPPRTQRS